jgi:hypothetical protein
MPNHKASTAMRISIVRQRAPVGDAAWTRFGATTGREERVVDACDGLPVTGRWAAPAVIAQHSQAGWVGSFYR